MIIIVLHVRIVPFLKLKNELTDIGEAIGGTL